MKKPAITKEEKGRDTDKKALKTDSPLSEKDEVKQAERRTAKSAKK